MKLRGSSNVCLLMYSSHENQVISVYTVSLFHLWPGKMCFVDFAVAYFMEY